MGRDLSLSPLEGNIVNKDNYTVYVEVKKLTYEKSIEMSKKIRRLIEKSDGATSYAMEIQSNENEIKHRIGF